MVPPIAISTQHLIEPNMSLDPELLVPIEETVGSDPAETTHLSNEKSDTSLVLPSTEDNTNSLVETKGLLDCMDDLSQELSPLLDKEGTCLSDTGPSNEHEQTLHSLVKESEPETPPSNSKSSSIEGQDISNVNQTFMSPFKWYISSRQVRRVNIAKLPTLATLPKCCVTMVCVTMRGQWSLNKPGYSTVY